MTSKQTDGRKEQITQDLVQFALKAGAEAADAIIFESNSQEASYRLGKLEDVERSESQDLGLRVFVGKQQASVSTTDFSMTALDALVERAVAMAKAAPEDPYCGLAPADQLAKGFPELDLIDTTEVTTEELAKLASEAEEASLAEEGITNSLLVRVCEACHDVYFPCGS